MAAALLQMEFNQKVVAHQHTMKHAGRGSARQLSEFHSEPVWQFVWILTLCLTKPPKKKLEPKVWFWGTWLFWAKKKVTINKILRDLSESLFLNSDTLSELQKRNNRRPKVIIWPWRSFWGKNQILQFSVEKIVWILMVLAFVWIAALPALHSQYDIGWYSSTSNKWRSKGWRRGCRLDGGDGSSGDGSKQ